MSPCSFTQSKRLFGFGAKVETSFPIICFYVLLKILLQANHSVDAWCLSLPMSCRSTIVEGSQLFIDVSWNQTRLLFKSIGSEYGYKIDGCSPFDTDSTLRLGCNGLHHSKNVYFKKNLILHNLFGTKRVRIRWTVWKSLSDAANACNFGESQCAIIQYWLREDRRLYSIFEKHITSSVTSTANTLSLYWKPQQHFVIRAHSLTSSTRSPYVWS